IAREVSSPVFDGVPVGEGHERHPADGGSSGRLANKARRRNADDRAAAAPDEDRPAEDAGIAAELPLPETVADNDHRSHRFAALRIAVFFVSEDPPANRLHTEHGKV